MRRCTGLRGGVGSPVSGWHAVAYVISGAAVRTRRLPHSIQPEEQTSTQHNNLARQSRLPPPPSPALLCHAVPRSETPCGDRWECRTQTSFNKLGSGSRQEMFSRPSKKTRAHHLEHSGVPDTSSCSRQLRFKKEKKRKEKKTHSFFRRTCALF